MSNACATVIVGVVFPVSEIKLAFNFGNYFFGIIILRFEGKQ